MLGDGKGGVGHKNGMDCEVMIMEYKSRVYTDRPEYADYEPSRKFVTLQSIVAKHLRAHPNAICSYSGGADSDIMIDLIEWTREVFGNLPPVKYVFFNTGLEMQATKDHVKEAAEKYGVEKFILVSTDKAVNPTNVMGCSKRICEIYCQSLNKAIQEGTVEGVTQFVTTRFGNVLGSNGSVIPIFREQIASGGPITVTDPNIIRYFMLIPEACKLVLEAGAMGHGGEIFVFDMGKPIKIVELAKRMITLSGAKNIEIKYTGLRDGEKLYEEVLSDKENTKPTVHPKIMVASVREYDYSLACENERRLLDASYRLSRRELVKMMEEIVPEYRSTNERYQ